MAAAVEAVSKHSSLVCLSTETLFILRHNIDDAVIMKSFWNAKVLSDFPHQLVATTASNRVQYSYGAKEDRGK